MNTTNRMPVLMLLGVVILILLGGVFLLGGSKPSQTKTEQPQTKERGGTQKEQIVTVTLTKDGFDPSTLTVKVGTRVIWLNKSGATASVNSEPHPVHTLYPFLNLGSVSDGSSVQAVFDKAGTYTYHNHFSPGEKGTVVVR